LQAAIKKRHSKFKMKIVVMYPYPLENDGQSLQGEYLYRGLKEIGEDVMQCDRGDSFHKRWVFEHFKPDIAIGVGYWGDTPDLIHTTLEDGVQPVPWFNADGWIANYQDDLNKLPLLVATSNWVKSTYMRDGVKGDNIDICPIGYDASIFYPRQKNDPAVIKLREMLGVKEDEKMILTAGGDVTSKGAQEMLQALAKVDKEFPKWKYVCKVMASFSTRDHGKEEKKLARELGLKRTKIKYIGDDFSPEFMSVLLNACDIYAAPSRLEGFGMIQVEAMACGKPVISINVGGPKDTVVHNKTGFLVDVAHEIKLNSEWVHPHMGFDEKKIIEFPIPKTFAYRADIDQLADCTLKLLKDDLLRDKMGQAGAKHALENFHYKIVARKMRDLIMKRVLNKDKEIEAEPKIKISE